MAKNNIELIKQSLAAAESSIRLAKQMLVELESGKVSSPNNKNKSDDVPGIVGVFDGEGMVTSDNKVFPVPANYASKSMLVVGDTLKLVEEGKEKRFKQVDHVKRYKTVGVLTKKDGKWKVITPEGSYKVLPAAVSHFDVQVGDEIVLFLPEGNLTVSYGAIEAVKKGQPSSAGPTVGEAPVVQEAPKVESVPVKEEIKEPQKEAAPKKPIAPKKAQVKVETPAPVVPEPPVVENTPEEPETPVATTSDDDLA